MVKPTDPDIAAKTMPALQAIGQTLLQCVVPIFCHERGKTEQEGCGFLVADGPNQFLISAAHVLRRIPENVLFISLGGKKLRPIAGRCAITPERGVPIDDDKIDVGVVLLEGSNLPPYPSIQKYSVEANSLLPNSSRGSGRYLYHVSGFPESKFRRKSKLERESVAYSYTNVEAAPDIYKKCAADPAAHFVLTFNQKKSMGPDGNLRAFPFPGGMSGSPLWRFDDDRLVVPLVGVVTDWRTPHKAIMATDIAFPMQMMARLSAEARQRA